MRRLTASLGSAIFLVAAPGTVAVYVPWYLSRWAFGPPFFGSMLTRALGLVLVAGGVFVLLDSFIRFALQGLGTPAPIAPPTRLVVTGLYRHVRNPMYVAVTAVVIGEALFLGSRDVLWYAAVLWLLFHGWVLLYEEPGLRRRFGESYRDY